MAVYTADQPAAQRKVTGIVLPQSRADVIAELEARNRLIDAASDAGQDAGQTFTDLQSIITSLPAVDAWREIDIFTSKVAADSEAFLAVGMARVYWSGFCRLELDNYPAADVLELARLDPTGTGLVAGLRDAIAADQAGQHG